MTKRIRGPVKRVRGELRPPSDKSISHRSLIIGAISKGKTRVRKWLRSADTMATLSILRAIGTKIEEYQGEMVVEGRSYEFSEPDDVLDAQNSGTTARLMMGVLATQPFFSVLTGDESLRKRPMARVIDPLRDMGAEIMAREMGNKLPAGINGRRLRAISFKNRKSSAQVKSALLLAGLRAEGITEVFEPVLSRDHTERMLRAFGCEVITVSEEKGHLTKIRGDQTPEGGEVLCPADPSSAAFHCALALLTEGEVVLREVLVNPTRDGFYRKLREMGADITYENEREIAGEPIADIVVRGKANLKAAKVEDFEIPPMIDEIPILAVVMALAEGRSEIRGAGELRVKESDRIRLICENLRRMGAEVEEFEDGFAVEGKGYLKGATVQTEGDHRIAMAFSVAGLVAEGETLIEDAECVDVSYPAFFKDIESLIENP